MMDQHKYCMRSVFSPFSGGDHDVYNSHRKYSLQFDGIYGPICDTRRPINALGTLCDALLNQSPKRWYNLQSDETFKRNENAGEENTALYFRWKRHFNKMQHNHCNGKPKRRRFRLRHVNIEKKRKKIQKKR